MRHSAPRCTDLPVPHPIVSLVPSGRPRRSVGEPLSCLHPFVKFRDLCESVRTTAGSPTYPIACLYQGLVHGPNGPLTGCPYREPTVRHINCPFPVQHHYSSALSIATLWAMLDWPAGVLCRGQSTPSRRNQDRAPGRCQTHSAAQ
jgi:hypothetical protein